MGEDDINSLDGNVPEFKSNEVKKFMSKVIMENSLEENRFKTISDFEDCMVRGGEVEFEFNERVFGITHDYDKIAIYEAYKQETEKLCKNVDEVLEYIIDDIRLRDIITEVKVWARTI